MEGGDLLSEAAFGEPLVQAVEQAGREPKFRAVNGVRVAGQLPRSGRICSGGSTSES